MKKLTLGLAVLLSGFAANSLAFLPTGTSRCDVSVPNYCGGFTFGVTGLWWRASSPEQDFATSFADIDLVTFDGLGDAHSHRNKHDYEWGFKANVGYIFPCSGNDVNLTYTHWDNDHHNGTDELTLPTDATLDAIGSPIFGPIIPLTGLATGIAYTPVLPLSSIVFDPLFTFDTLDTHVSSKTEFENHTWDLDFGQAINVGCNFKVRWFGGLRYTHLEYKQNTTFETVLTGSDPLLAFTGGELLSATVFDGAGVLAGTELALDVFDHFHNRSKFNGIGPRLGFDLNWGFCNGFGVVGSLSAALLVGEEDSSLTQRVTLDGAFAALGITLDGVSGITVPAVPEGTTYTVNPFISTFAFDTGFIGFHHPDETRVVPNIDAKLGLDWTYQFCNCSRSKLTIEAGYLVSHYFNAIDRLSAVEFTDPEFRTRHTIDTSFDGPYVSVQVAL